MPLALVIPIQRPADASQLPAPVDPAHKPTPGPGEPGHKPAPTPPPPNATLPIYFPGSPEQGVPPVLAFPSHDLPTTPGAHPSHDLPKDPRRPRVGGQLPTQPGRQPGVGGQLPSTPGAHPGHELPDGIQVIGPPIYIEGNPPLVGWELPEHPTHKPAPKPPEEVAQPKK
jgi:hypothetical protein